MAQKILFGVVLVLLVVAFYTYAGEVKLTTYYPAPYGEYKRIATKTLGVGNNDGSADGAITSSDAPDPATSSGDVWIAGKLGIGTTAPAGALDVRGGSAAAATNGTSLNFYAQRGGSGNTNGGNIILMPGLGSGTGTEGNVGIGTPTPAYPLDIFKIYHTLGSYQSPLNVRGLYTDAGAGDNNGIRIIAEAGHTSGSIDNLAGASIVARNLNEGSVSYLRGLVVRADNNSTSGGNVSEGIGVLIQANTGPGTITNNYGIYQAGTTAKNYFGGDVGIGTTTPSNILEVRRDATAATNGITLNNQQGTGWGSSLTFLSKYTGSFPAAQIIGGGTTGTQGRGILQFATGDGSGLSTRMTLNHYGYLGIGTTDPQHRLDVYGTGAFLGNTIYLANPDSTSNPGKAWGMVVNTTGGYLSIGTAAYPLPSGGALTTPIFQILPSNKAGALHIETSGKVHMPYGVQADYVFNPGYKLMSIEEVAEFIRTHHCLPHMGKDEGNDGSVNDLLTKHTEKIEELTLYIIKQNEQIKALEKKVEQLTKK